MIFFVLDSQRKIIDRALREVGQRIAGEAGDEKLSRGDLLAAMEPSQGTGVDFSEEMVRLAQSRHPHITFIQADAHELELDQTFDVIILSDLVNDLWDVEQAFKRVAKHCDRHTRIIINC